MTTGIFSWWSLAQRCPIRSWSYNRSVNRGGRTYSSCTMLRKDRRNPGPPTGNWQSGGGCQWAAMVRQYTNSGGRGYRGCQGRGSPSCLKWLELRFFAAINTKYYCIVYFHCWHALFNISNNLAFTLFRDVGRSYQTASGALYQIGKSLLQVVFTNLKQLARTTTKSTENDMEGNVM